MVILTWSLVILLMDFNIFYLFIFLFALFGVVLLPIYLVLRFLRAKKNMSRALNMGLFLVTLPQMSARKATHEEGEAPRQRKEIISVMEQFYASLSSLKDRQGTLIYGGQPLVLEIATPHSGGEISFYIAAPKRWGEAIEKQIHGFFPDAMVQKIRDYNIFNPQGASSGAYLKLIRDQWLPFRTYQHLAADPLNEIVNALSKLEEQGEGAALQILIRPSGKRWRKLGLKIAKKMQEGKTYLVARDESVFLSLRKLLHLSEIAFGNARKKKEKELAKQGPFPKQLTPLHQETIKALEGKASKTGFEANIRLLASAPTRERAEQILTHLESAFAQFEDPNFNKLQAFRVRGQSLKQLIYNFSFRLFNPRQKSVLSTEELTSLYHFSTATVKAPKLKFLKAKSAPPPPNLPKEGLVLGHNIFRGEESVVRLSNEDRRRHLYIIGQTGTGKSAFLQNMAHQDIFNGQGLAVLDPHGDLIEKILGLIPPERAEDVVLCDPSDLERPLGLNMLEYDPNRPEQKTFIVNELINIFDKLYDLKTTGGPMFEQYTRNALLLLMDDPAEGATLMEVPRVLSDRDFRRRLLDKCRNIVVKDFWEKEAEKAGGEASLANMVPYVTSKFNTFIANDYMRPIIGQAKSTLNFREILDSGKILLVSLPKGRLGEINSSLLGLIVVGKLVMASFARIDIPEQSRRDFYLYMDEFQNFTTQSIETALSEARKYRLCLTIAHQFIGQLPDDIKEAVFGNVGSIVSFRIGAQDAEFLVKQFEPIFDQNDLINIDNYNAYVKMLINGQTAPAFNMTTYPPANGRWEIAQNIKQLSRLKYGREKALIEAEVYERLKR